jgi:hypothetical protein
MYAVMMNVWEEEMAKDSDEGTICLTFKKENILNCANYREITSVNTS